MSLERACEALKAGKLLELNYGEFIRHVEVHAAGRDGSGIELMRVWQVSGGRKGRERSGWKLLRLDEVAHAAVLEQPSKAPRRGYRRNDPALKRIMYEL